MVRTIRIKFRDEINVKYQDTIITELIAQRVTCISTLA